MCVRESVRQRRHEWEKKERDEKLQDAREMKRKEGGRERNRKGH